MFFAQIGCAQFSASALPHMVYVGQQISYDGTMQISAVSPPRFLESPEYTPPDVKGVMTYRFPFDARASIRPVVVKGVPFTRYTYHQAFFPLTAGTDTIPPSTLAYTCLNEADPYVSPSTTLRSAQEVVVVLPLPTVGRPTDFSGAVGQFTVAAEADRLHLHVGDGFAVRMTISGTGNLPLLQRQAVMIPWATVVNTSDTVSLDFTGAQLRGVKEFRWLVTPHVGGLQTIPPFRFSYFDPATKSYRMIGTAAISVTIAGGGVASAPASGQESLRTTSLIVPTHTLAAHLIMLLLGGVLLAALIVMIIGIQRRVRRSPAEVDRPFKRF